MTHKENQQDAWLCLRLTDFALNSAGIKSNSSVASAIVEQQQLFQCNQTAKQSGLQPGMSVNHALMLNPQLSMQERDCANEARKLQELSHWAYRFSSQVCLYKEDTLLLEIGRSIKLFKGLKHLINLINNDLNSFGFCVSIGIAHTPKAAYLLSYSNPVPPEQALPQALHRLLMARIEDLDVELKTLRQLQHCGFESLQDLESIPAAELGRRVGKGFLHYLDQLWGRTADPQTTTTPPETFNASADFAEPIRNLNWIHQQIDRLLHDLARFITDRQLVCRSFTWRFYHENNRLLQTVTIGLSAKQNKVSTLRELTDLKLASLTLDWEFASIELSSTQLVPRTLFHDDLFDPRPDQEQFNQLIDKLTNRLGQHALFRVHAAHEHLPELANDRKPAIRELNEQRSVYHVAAEPLKDQPLWLLETPQRLPQSHNMNQRDRPQLNGPLTIIHGPDRITSHWWSKIQSRDYFIARQKNGRLLWLFFDRDQKGWFLHGLFA